MDSVSYSELHQQVSPDIDAEIAAALDLLGPSADAVRKAVDKLLRHQQMKHPLSVLPLLVHAAETGRTGPAVPLSALHLLWWTSACYLDDLADGQSGGAAERLDMNEAVLASVITGNVLPVRLIQSQDVPEPVRSALIAELTEASIMGAEGQLADMRGEAGRATRKGVLEVYRGKSGGPFAMITAMAAILSGTTTERIALWREFGQVFGLLWQMFNDQEDVASGRNEDLANGTVTYLLACALEDAAPEARAHILDLCAAARISAPARSKLTALLLAPPVLDGFREDVSTYRDEADRILGELGGDERYLPALRQLVDLSAQILLQPDPRWLPPTLYGNEEESRHDRHSG
ncbi:polyprenyl synthetase family protein [Streptomyces sp. NBC_01298]|uniref:polyprenyl synthetase family protein n=1 Tax=Streptomyces sp. NBC_01298 TaxID=2903817 RepID=UPI002E16571C|nr:polyprenyl synthetase family protein [Streptomyces sp. NBC_01298]